MHKEDLYGWMDNPDRLDASSLEELKRVLEEYPYFHTARLLYTKNLNLTDSPDYGEELGRTALLCNDRRKLFYFIYREEYANLVERDEDVHPSRGDRTEELLESFLSSLGEKEVQGPSAVENLTLNLATTDYFSYLQSLDGGVAGGDPSERQPLQHQDIIDAFIEKAESDILFVPKETPADQTGQFASGGTTSGRTDQSASGGTSPTQAGQFVPGEAFPDRTGQIGEIKETEGGEFLTETLARIYIKQKKYAQALTIIKRLSLNFPKKSVYFAHQIRFLELLIMNEKNKNI